MKVNCFWCNDPLDVPTSVLLADPYRDEFLCDPCELVDASRWQFEDTYSHE